MSPAGDGYGQPFWSPELWQTVYGLRRFAETEPEQEVLLGPFKRSQVGWIAAPAGAGKSMLALKIAGAIVMGEGFGPWEATASDQPRTAKVIDAELTARDLIGRVEIMGLQYATIMFDHYANRMRLDTDAFSLGDPYHQEYIMDTCKGSDVIVIDNVTFTLDPAPGHNLHSPETINQMRPLFAWAKAQGKLMILVDHTNAEGRLAGSLNKQRLADWVALLEPASLVGDMELAFTLKFDKYRGQGRPKQDYAFSMNQLGAWSCEPVVSLADQVRDMLADHIPLKDIAKELDCSYSYVKRISAAKR